MSIKYNLCVLQSSLLLLLALGSTNNCQAEWLTRIPTESGRGKLEARDGTGLYFLEFGDHFYGPDGYLREDGKKVDFVSSEQAVPLALFQGLSARRVTLAEKYHGQEIGVTKGKLRDEFWDQILTVELSAVNEAPRYVLSETGTLGAALPTGVRQLHLNAKQIDSQQRSLHDPHISHALDRELSWTELESLAFPLDYQKVLLASAKDSSPGFAFQNGQWLTTWLSRDLPKWTKEDHWFAPALLLGNRLIRPAPLSARTSFTTTAEGKTIPLWTLEWHYNGVIVRQLLFSHPVCDSGPHVHVLFTLQNAPEGTRLALGVGRRPNVHYWDNSGHERTPIPFFSLAPNYHHKGNQLIDNWNRIVLESVQSFELESVGPVEMLLIFTPAKNGTVYLRTPQNEVSHKDRPFSISDFNSSQAECETFWLTLLRQGARASLPSAEWMKRIDIWKTQVAAITRVNYQGQERLSYGAYFYQAFFGPEEGWPIVALAQWGQGEEAQRQANIMLSAENRSKENVHHQSRNGAFAWYAAEVARLTNDKEWLESIAPALMENAEWTINAINSTRVSGLPVTRGLLPPHIYGGDIRDPATSLYASVVCWKGLSETADVFHELGSKSLQEKAQGYDLDAREFKQRIAEVIELVTDQNTQPPFIPLALALPSLDGKHEGPYERLTASRLGNYWNLFTPSVLELGFASPSNTNGLNSWLFEYMETHGGLWAGLPRFHYGLDAAYSIGVINELIVRSVHDVKFRDQALATLQSFFLHAASRNGYTIPEVAGLFPYRLNSEAYERLVRESPWNFGMYDANRYLEGHISFTEPLGAAAGEALWLIRKALITETRDRQGIFDGGIFLLSTVPSDWFNEGQEIKLEDFPTYYGKLSIHVRSRVESAGEIEMEYQFTPHSTRPLKSIVVRLSPSGFTPQDLRFVPERSGKVRAKFPSGVEE